MNENENATEKTKSCWSCENGSVYEDSYEYLQCQCGYGNTVVSPGTCKYGLTDWKDEEVTNDNE